MRQVLAAAAILILSACPLTAKEKPRLSFTLHGFLVGNLAVRGTGERPANGEGGEFVLGEERLRLDIGGANKNGSGFFLIKGDVFHDALRNDADGDLREGYAGYRRGPFDLRVGRQILTWGVGDLFFINDVFPKDWESFFSGRPMEYLKRGIDAARVQYSSNALNVDLVATPFFRPDTLPSAKRFFLYNPFTGVTSQREASPAAVAANTEIALRLYRHVSGFDVSLYGYRGFWRTPAARLESDNAIAQVLRFYPRLVTWGISAQRNWLQGVISLEGGRFRSQDDRSGLNPAIPNSEWRVLAGYQQQLGRELTATFQGYAEITDRYDTYRRSLPPGAPAKDRVRGVLSVRLTQFWGYQNWRLSIFFAHSPTDSDYFLQPEISHRLTDKLSGAVGSNIFGGRRPTTFFGQMGKNDNIYLSARFDF